jgi:hypothetical protein
MVTRAELGAVIERALLSKDTDARVCALALQRYLLRDGRKARFDKRAYMKGYMVEWRARRKREGKRGRKQ